MAVSAAQVKELRERTSLGMLECKKALKETDGDIELAIENLRKSGQAKAAKKAGRTAAEGAVVVALSDDAKRGALVEINSETDFVARDEGFLKFAQSIAQVALQANTADVTKIAEQTLADGVTVEEARLALVQKIGENVQIRRAAIVDAADGIVGAYIHSGKIGVLTQLTGGDAELGKDISMHVAASNPAVVNPEDVAESVLESEKGIIRAQPDMAGKPEEIVEKMLVGRVKKFLKEISLVEQPFIKDPNTSVGALAKAGGATINAFIRLEVGEGIEKEEVDFAAEVAAAAKGA